MMKYRILHMDSSEDQCVIFLWVLCYTWTEDSHFSFTLKCTILLLYLPVIIVCDSVNLTNTGILIFILLWHVQVTYDDDDDDDDSDWEMSSDSESSESDVGEGPGTTVYTAAMFLKK